MKVADLIEILKELPQDGGAYMENIFRNQLDECNKLYKR